MPRYVYKHSNFWVENNSILENEIQELEKWLHSSGIDPDFEPDTHVYQDPNTNDITLSLPELTKSQLFAATLIMSSSELYFDNKPVKFDKPPVTWNGLDDADLF